MTTTLPSPGQLKMVSVTIAPASSAPNCGDDAWPAMPGPARARAIGVSHHDKVRRAIVQSNGCTEIAVNDAGPIMNVLAGQRLIETELVAKRADVCRSGSFAKHHLDRVAGNKVNQQKNQRRHHQPDSRQRQSEADEELLDGLDSTINEACGRSATATSPLETEAVRQPMPAHASPCQLKPNSGTRMINED